ncbi:DUF2313 domain-containing protein [Bosea sp. F3-2]|uniref:DUF2313 domain-containing protein n=1 Tax=Bosea sp. F3-2 TaxID=2599640 RepID=UPI0011EE606D|nr:DUF2313 domain-containing protein [Bosea sp. F3-2]QEL26161.1 DUF2313 domain-containing protein [Bosea sp. F3-2]
MICPSDGEVAASIAALRPRGAAWRNGGHDALAGSTMGDFFDALGEVSGEADRRICALVDEYFCSSAVETLDLWALEYGVPDGCDPFADVCEKVNAVGDSIPAYAEAAALRRGWSISIDEEFITTVQSGRLGNGRLGVMRMAAAQGVAWRITVDLANSPAYVAADRRKPLMGRMRLGFAFDCGPAITPLSCLIRRIAPAHADLVFATI